MLELTVRDEGRDVVLKFEHSLRSLSKWESKHKKPWHATAAKTSFDMIEYYQDMLLESQDPTLVYRLSPEELDSLTDYINDPMTASSVPYDGPPKPNREVMTSELIYYWMTALKINWEAQDWHLNRLMMLIQIASVKSQPEKKRSRGELLNVWADIKKRNKEKFGIEG